MNLVLSDGTVWTGEVPSKVFEDWESDNSLGEDEVVVVVLIFSWGGCFEIRELCRF